MLWICKLSSFGQVCDETLAVLIVWHWVLNTIESQRARGRCMNMTQSALSSFIYVLSYFYVLMLNSYMSHGIYIPHTRWLSSQRQGVENNLRSLSICMRHYELDHSGGMNIQYIILVIVNVMRWLYGTGCVHMSMKCVLSERLYNSFFVVVVVLICCEIKLIKRVPVHQRYIIVDMQALPTFPHHVGRHRSFSDHSQ